MGTAQSDPDTGEEMNLVHFPWTDEQPPVAYEYVKPGFPPLRFYVIERNLPSAEGERRVVAAVMIGEQSLREEYLHHYPQNGTAEDQAAAWEALRARVAEGILRASDHGGKYYKWSPDLHVEWKNFSAEDAWSMVGYGSNTNKM